LNYSSATQGHGFDLRNWPEISGKITVSNRKAPEIYGKRKQHSGPEKSENLPTRNTASMKSPEFPGIDPFLAVLFDLGIDALFSIEIFEYPFSFLSLIETHPQAKNVLF
jgi:hypothetical protein